MESEEWKEQYKEWKPTLKAFQIKILDDGAHSLSQSWLLNAMWSDWNDLKRMKETDRASFIINDNYTVNDPWE